MCRTKLISSLFLTFQILGDDSRFSRVTNLPHYLRDSVINDFVPNRDNVNLRAVVTNCVD